jgi:hypothetical protein
VLRVVCHNAVDPRLEAELEVVSHTADVGLCLNAVRAVGIWVWVLDWYRLPLVPLLHKVSAALQTVDQYHH